MISRTVELSVRVIRLSLRLRLITPTSTSIILDITKTSSNNCLFFFLRDNVWKRFLSRKYGGEERWVFRILRSENILEGISLSFRWFAFLPRGFLKSVGTVLLCTCQCYTPRVGGGTRGNLIQRAFPCVGILTLSRFPRVGNLTCPPSWKTERPGTVDI